jgi:hypothetical protein
MPMNHHEKQLADEAADKAVKKALDKLKTAVSKSGRSNGRHAVMLEKEYYEKNETVILPKGCECLTREQVVGAYHAVLANFEASGKWSNMKNL